MTARRSSTVRAPACRARTSPALRSAVQDLVAPKGSQWSPRGARICFGEASYAETGFAPHSRKRRPPPPVESASVRKRSATFKSKKTALVCVPIAESLSRR
jgi:hypothetical protein